MPFHKVLMAILVMVIFGLNAVMNKIGVNEFPPLVFTFLRFVILLPGVFFIRRPKISWAMLFAISCTLAMGFILFSNIGLALGATAGTYSFIAQTGTIFAIGATYLILGNKPSKFDVVGILLGLVGIYWICASQGIDGSVEAISWLVASAIMWGLGFTLVKKAQAPSIPTIIWTSIFAVPVLALSSLAVDGSEIYTSVTNASTTGWFSVFFSSWVGMLGAGGLMIYLIRTEEVAKVMPYNMLVPVTGCLFAWLILHEQLNVNLVFGGSWILAGLVVAQVLPRVIYKQIAPIS